MIRSLGLMGYGNFGAFLHLLAERYLPEIELKIHSRRRGADGVPFFPLEEVAACDAVILAVPIGAYETTLDRIAPIWAPAAFWSTWRRSRSTRETWCERRRPAGPS